MKNNFFYFLPFLFLFNLNVSKAQSKLESNLNQLDLKTKYFQVAVKDTFGLKELVNLKGIAKLKYEDNSFYFSRNGLLNHFFGGEINLKGIQFYHNSSNQNIKNESSEIQDSPIGQISTKTTLLNKNLGRENGGSFNYENYFFSFENASNSKNIQGQTLIDIGGEKDLTTYEFKFKDETDILGFGFKYGFFKFIQNKQNEDKFNNYFVKANYTDSEKDFTVYYAKDFAGFFKYNFWDKIDVNITYDKKFNLTLSTSGYSEMNKKDFERNLENKLRVVPRIYDSNLEISRNYLEDMFFTKLYSFSINKDKIIANLNFKNFLFHYSKDSYKIGLKYEFGIATYDFKNKEAKLGIFFD